MLIVFFRLQNCICLSIDLSEISYQRDRKQKTMMYGHYSMIYVQRNLFHQCEPALQRLPAPGLRGTWARAYALLTRLVSQIGWDELLKTRSQVFVMEEEYRMQKTQNDIQQVLSASSTNGFPLPPSLDMGTAVIHEDGTVKRPSSDDQVSTRGIRSPSPTIQQVSIPEANGNDNEPPASAVPTIRISTDSSREDNDSKEEENGQEDFANDDKDDTEENESEWKDTVDRKKEKGKAKEVERPVKAAGEGDQNVNEASPAPAQEPFSFSNKRLCERWLDNLFMVLYEVGYPSFLVDHRLFNYRFT
jgi:hypothetical protein